MNGTQPTEASLYLRALARRNAKVYAALPTARAIILTGSSAEGVSDQYSDIDMIVYYDSLPSEEELRAACEQNQGQQRRPLAERTDDAFMETFFVQGVDCQIVHTTIALWEQEMASVLEQLDVTTPTQKALSGLL